MIGLPAVTRHESVALVGQLSLGLVAACLSGAVVIAAAFRGAPPSFGRLRPAVPAANLLPVLFVGSAPRVPTGAS